MKIQRKIAFPVAALLLVAATLVPPALAQQDNQTDSQVAAFQKIEDQWSTAWVSQGQFTLEAGGEVKTAIAMLRLGTSAADARQQLLIADGRLRQVLGEN